MSDDRPRILPKPLLVVALVVGTIAASVSISALVIDADPPAAELPENVELKYKRGIVPSQGLRLIVVDCPLGKVATGGGHYSFAPTSNLFVLDSVPVRTGSRYGWRVRFSNRSDREIAVGTVAICAAVAIPGGPLTVAPKTQTQTRTTTTRSP